MQTQDGIDASDLVARLGQHRTLGAVARGELAWLATHGVTHTLAVGDVTTYKGQPEMCVHVILTGRLVIHVDRGAGSRKIVEWRGGDVCGLMPYSRGASPPGDTVAEEPTTTLAVHRDLYPQMMRECPEVIAVLVHTMLDRARYFTSGELHDEKLVALGKLAAGLAHELNNPVSAAARSAKLIATSLADLDAAARQLEAARLSDEQLAAIQRVRTVCEAPADLLSQSPIERADREETIADWLDARGLDDSCAASLAGTDVTTLLLDTLATALTGTALDAAIRSIATRRVLSNLASEIDHSASRIHALVAAVKGFTYMDRATTPEPTDIRRGITDTLAVLVAKTHAKSVAVQVTFDPDLPRVRAYGGELNQVWANLVDNALDAVATSGRVDVMASREADRIVVRIVDDGPGIAREIQGRIFDPFFTTKRVGEGTGLGLDIVRRLLQRNDGEIDVDSRPGRTEFRVSLPMDTLAQQVQTG